MAPIKTISPLRAYFMQRIRKYRADRIAFSIKFSMSEMHQHDKQCTSNYNNLCPT
jgi:hypothetical protein